ncbi:hypothetical protein [Burkholderia cepacia]|uniref:hypothetical protein n=1 Tax=Burkholderia cepacia TaxID=292 RepID=UPI002AB5EA6F|nr:hypothetical protein [Burkholderia cepacia]
MTTTPSSVTKMHQAFGLSFCGSSKRRNRATRRLPLQRSCSSSFTRDNNPVPAIGSNRWKQIAVAIHGVKPKVAAEALANDIYIAHEFLPDPGEAMLAAMGALIPFGKLAAPRHPIPPAECRYAHQ